MARLFNAYVIAHWSAASKPATGADSLWLGVLKRDVRFRFIFEAGHSYKAESDLLGSKLKITDEQTGVSVALRH